MVKKFSQWSLVKMATFDQMLWLNFSLTILTIGNLDSGYGYGQNLTTVSRKSWPPKNLSGRTKVCFGPPPQNFDQRALPKWGPVIKIFARLLLSTLKWAKFFACGGLIREGLISLVILVCKAKQSDQFPLPCNIL